MDKTQDFKSLQDQIQASLLSTTRVANQISAEDLGFQRSLDPAVGTSLDEQSARLLALSSALLKSAASIADLRVPALEDSEDVDNNWRGVVDIVDSLLEKTDTCLDEYTGVIKRRESPAAEQVTQKSKKNGNLGNAFRNQNLLKPQLAFDVKPDNNDNSPWKPLLTTKPHAIRPLEECLGTFTNEFDQIQYDYSAFLPLLLLPPTPSTPEGLSKSQRDRFRKHMKKFKTMGSTIGETDSLFRYRHPYETEILHLIYPEAVYKKADPVPYLPVDTTSAIFVDTLEGVLEMLEELKTATEIAVDLEHHDTRSYVGLVSLMQISTRNKDWIVDTLKPWRQNLQVLNEVFTDPKIMKVFHGAYMDIVWLQRDLGLYVVGLFDTHHASRALGYQGGSLAFLLKKFIDFDADKQYQLADWRIRPLPDEMFYYARADTHYLLYIYDNMRNELVEKTNPEVPEENRTEIVLQKSKETSLLRYERQVYNIESGKGHGGWYNLLVKTPALFNSEQFAVFRAIHAWRDKIARLDDDSTAYVMPNRVIFNIARMMPMDMVALLALAHPISHGVKSRSGELMNIIKAAKANGKSGPNMMDILRPDNFGAIAKENLPSLSQVAPKTLVAVMEESELVTDQSSFWGEAFGSSIWDPAPIMKDDGLRLAVPLPQLSSEIFATSNGLVDRSREKVEQPVQPTSSEVKQADEAFVLKRGSKRKTDVISEPDEDSEDNDISLADTEQNGKARRKAERRARKKLKKELKVQQEAEQEAQKEAAAEDEDEDEEQPFDYSKAESVLHGKRIDGEKGGKKKKPYNPYAKSADAPKGMRRVQTERAGKSHTFKK